MILEKVQKVIGEQLRITDFNTIQRNTSLRKDLQADSLDAAEIIFTLEDEFKIEVDESEIENFQTVDDICNYIEKNI